MYKTNIHKTHRSLVEQVHEKRLNWEEWDVIKDKVQSGWHFVPFRPLSNVYASAKEW